MAHVFVTGDRHGDYNDIEAFCMKWNTSKDDLMIVLGDNGVNYFGHTKDRKLKRYLSALPISFFMIKGNHDQRPSRKYYQSLLDPHPLVKGYCWVESDYPSIIFSDMYGWYHFLSRGRWWNTYVIGGAYSADKWYRLEMQEAGYKQYRWFPDEQMSKYEMDVALGQIKNIGGIDFIMSHTCPHKYIPHDMFLSQIDQSTVDDTMERWMDSVEESVHYDRWLCGHWHTDRVVDKMRFMFHGVIELGGSCDI